MKNLAITFVFIYFDPRKPGYYGFGEISFDFEPIYVGKGKYNRPKRHLSLYKNNKNNIRFYNKLNSIIRDGYEPIYKIIDDSMFEFDAFKEEIYLINLIGRIENGGTLLNLSDGGEGQSGYRHSDMTKQKISKSILSNKEWLDKMKSAEMSKKISNSLKGHPGYGKGVPRTEEVKNKIRNSVLGEKNPFFGKTHSQELINSMKLRNKGKSNPNSKIYVIKIDDVEISFEGRVELKRYIDDYNSKNNLSGPNRVSLDGILNKGFSKNFTLISTSFLNRS